MTNKPKDAFRLVIIASLVSLMIPALAAAQSQAPRPHIRSSSAPSSFASVASVASVDTSLASAVVGGAEAPAKGTPRRSAWLRSLHPVHASELRAAPAHTTVVRSVGAPVPPRHTGVNWYAIAACESGGNWAINTGNGYWGGLQFSPHTWFANGGGPFSGSGPFPYSAGQQIAVAERIYAGVGLSAWPYCGRFG